MAAILNYWILGIRRVVFFGILPVIFGILVALQGWFWSRDASAFIENLRQTEARVLRINSADSELLIDVEYFTDSGIRYEKQFKVDNSHEEELKAIGKTTLVYDARYPQVAELGHVITANNEHAFYLGMAVCGALLSLAGLCFIGARVKGSLEIVSLFRSGTLVNTEVRDCVLAPGQDAGRFTYAFRGPNGRWFDGKSPEMPAVRLKQWPVGRRLLVAYDPSDPRRSEADVFELVDAKRRNALQTAGT